MRLPDVSTEKVASCAGAPDMSLCEVVTEPDREYDVCIEGECVSPGCGDVSCNTAGPRFRMPPLSGHHYFERDSGEEPVVVDLITGLYWQGCFAGKQGDDCATGSATMLTWQAAFEYCGELDWGGHDDWYLPDMYEWGSLHTNDESAFGDPALFPDATFYGFTSVSDVFGDIFVKGGAGELFDEHLSPESIVRCVRRGFSEPVPAARLMRFAPVAATPDELIVRDAATHLDWQACEACEYDGSPEKLLYEDAFEYCESLEWAGFEDYRLPTVKEHLTARSFRLTTGSSFEPFEAFKHGAGSLHANWGREPEHAPGVLTDRGGIIATLPMSMYQTVCVRDTE